jgi:hypothetical protein
MRFVCGVQEVKTPTLPAVVQIPVTTSVEINACLYEKQQTLLRATLTSGVYIELL